MMGLALRRRHLSDRRTRYNEGDRLGIVGQVLHFALADGTLQAGTCEVSGACHFQSGGVYGRDHSSRYRIARRHEHERLTQLLFCPRLGLFHCLQAPVLGRLLTDLDRDAEVMVRISPLRCPHAPSWSQDKCRAHACVHILAMLPSLSPFWLGILASLTDFFIRMTLLF